MSHLSLITNIVTSLFCAAVLVQTFRLSRAVGSLRHAGLVEVVATLDASTEASQQALAALNTVLTNEGPALDAAVRSSRDIRAQLVALRDELSLMIDIGNGVAERILAAADGARGTASAGQGEVHVAVADNASTPEASNDTGEADTPPRESAPAGPIASTAATTRALRQNRSSKRSTSTVDAGDSLS